MNQKVIVEFYGLPGSGKTTIVNETIKELKDKYKVFTLDDVYFYKQGKFNELLIYIKSIIYFDNFRLIISLLRCFKSISRERLSDSLRLLKFRYQLIKFYQKENFDVLILEEGLIQYLTSVAYKNPLNLDQMTKLFKSTEIDAKDYYYINLFIDKHESLDRIRKRALLDKNTAKRRTDSLGDEYALTVLAVTKTNMDLINGLIQNQKNVIISSMNTINESVNLITSFVNKYIHNNS